MLFGEFTVVTFHSIIYLMTKNTLKKFGSRTWCTKKPFGYRFVHQHSCIHLEYTLYTPEQL